MCRHDRDPTWGDLVSRWFSLLCVCTNTIAIVGNAQAGNGWWAVFFTSLWPLAVVGYLIEAGEIE